MADKTVRGRFVWHELMTPDTAGAHAFYSKALGWKTQPWEEDPSYSMFAAASGPLGGAVAETSGAPHWLPYIGTPDIDPTVQKTTSLGGQVVKEITTLPTGGKYALLADPQGAAFGVYWSATEPARSRRRSAVNSPGTSSRPATGRPRSTSTRASSAGRKWPSTTWARWACT